MGLFYAHARRSTIPIIVALFALFATVAASSDAGNAFSEGAFERAKAGYLADLARTPTDADAAAGLARVELYANRLDSAEHYARQVTASTPGDVASRVIETIAQRRAIAQSAETLTVPDSGIVLPFLESEPLPAVSVSVNGKAGTFLIDTGAGDVTLDPEFAQACGLSIRGGREGIFLGGKTAEVREAVADRIDAGSVTLTTKTVSILPSRGMHLYAKRTIDGVVGTVFLSRFQATIDYPRHRLVLRPRSSVPIAARGRTIVPMWLVGDHFLFASGTVNASPPQLFSIDSGGAGVGFMPVAADITTFHIRTFKDKAFQAMGGGGPTTVIPTIADRVCLGTACQTNVGGAYSPGGSPLSIFPFTVGGTVSHDFLKRYAVTLDFTRMEMVLSSS